MEKSNTFSKKLFWIITVYSSLLAVAVCFGLHVSIIWVLESFSEHTGSDLILKNVSQIIKQADILSQYFYSAVTPIIMVTLWAIGWLLWLVLRLAQSPKMSENDDRDQSAHETVKKDFIDRKLEQDRKRRLFLHSLSVLQREGRLLDFFSEDLSLYEDEQIGAAVRSIQEDCKKTIKKYVHPISVVDIEEGGDIVIEEGFDIDSIKLTGNVSGQPPFMGIVKHQGWKAGKKEIPKLSDIQDATIIVPAEVEIQ